MTNQETTFFQGLLTGLKETQGKIFDRLDDVVAKTITLAVKLENVQNDVVELKKQNGAKSARWINFFFGVSQAVIVSLLIYFIFNRNGGIR